MAGKIKQSDVAEQDVYGLITASAEKLSQELKELDSLFIKQTKRVKDLGKAYDKLSQKGIDTLVVKEKKLEEISKKVIKLDKQKVANSKVLQKARLEEIRVQKAREVAMDKFNSKEAIGIKQAQKAKRVTVDSANAYKVLSKNVNSASARLKRMAAQYGLTDKRTIQAQRNFDRLEKKLRGVNNAARDGRRDVGRYGTALNGVKGSALRMLGALGLLGGGLMIFRNAFSTIKDFEQGQADLASILGTNVDGMKALTDQAKELGATTTFTATQVAGLQKEFAKLGFTQQEIENVTAATLALAEATGTDLSDAATVTGATIRGFGLDSKDTQRVVDVMAKSFSASSLDMTKFSTAMATVAPVAKAMGLTIEETTALIATMTDSGVEASTAGTGLRNMMLNAKKAGLTLDEALAKIANSSDKVGTSFDLFGKRGATLGVILADNQKQTSKLTKELKDSDGAAKKMADTQRNTLGGALKLVASAWDGFILSMNEAGSVGDVLKDGLLFIAKHLETIVSVIGKVIRAFVIYKTTMIAMNVVTKLFATESGKMAFNLKNVSKNLKSGTGAAKGFGKALKGIGFAVAIELLIELAVAWNDVASGAQRARKEAELYQRTIDRATKSTDKFVNAIRDKMQVATNQINKDLAAGDIDEAEAARRHLKNVKRGEESINLKVKEIRISKDKALADKIHAQAELIRLRQKAIAEADPTATVLTSKTLRDIERQKNAIADATATEKGFTASIVKLKEESKGLTQTIIDQDIAITASSNSTEDNTYKTKKNVKEKKKLISLLRQITDEQLSRIKDDEEKELALATEATKRRIEDLQLENATEKEKAILTVEINESLVVELAAIRKRFRDEELEEERLFREKERQIAEEAAKFEQAQILKVRSDILKEKKFELLFDEDKTKKEVNREFLEFEISQLELRYDLTIDEDIKLEEKRRQIREQDAKKQKDDAKKLRDELERIGEEVLNTFIENSQKKQGVIDGEIDASKALEDRLRESAQNGNAIASESLAAQESITEEKTRQKQKEAKKEALLEEAKAIWNALNNFLDAGDSLPAAGAKAIGGVIGIKTLVNGLTGFFKGTKGRLKDEHKATISGKDGHVVRVDGDEAILTGDKMDSLSAVGLNTTDDIVNSAIMNQQLKGITMSHNNGGNASDNTQLIKEIQGLKAAVKNNKPTAMHPVFKRGLLNAIVEQERKNGKTVRTWTYK